MKPLATWILLSLPAAFAGTDQGQLRMVPATEPPRVFAGAARSFPVVWQNTGGTAVTADLRLRLLQASSATAAPLGEWPWKQLYVLPGQTVLEQATLDFPEVRAETRFLIKWIEGTNRIFGTSAVLVYPTNLLAQLKPLAGEKQPVGVFDPGNVLKPLLQSVSVDCEDLESSGLASFRGSLAIIGPFASREQMPEDLTERVGKLARGGAVIVWLLPRSTAGEKLQPSFRTVFVGKGTVVVAQPQLVLHLPDDPQAQWNLIRLCEQARHPEPATLPSFAVQP